MPLRDAIRNASVGLTAPDPDATAFPGQGLFALLRSLERELWLLAAAAMVLDAVLTVYGQHLGIHEANPVVRHALASFGAIGLYVLKVLAMGIALLGRAVLPGRVGFAVPLGLLLPTAYAVVVNSYVLYLTLA